MLCLLLGFVGVGAASGDPEPPQESQSRPTAEARLDSAPATEPGPELEGERTATSRTFELPDGSRETRLFQSPVNYRDGEGDWQPIEEGLEGKDGSALTNGDNTFDLALPARLGGGPVRFTDDGVWVASKLLGASSAPVDLEDGTATYELANPDTSIELSTFPNGLKENIELAGPSAPSTYRFELSASAGVEPTLVSGGAIEFRDKDDHLVAALPAPYMFDNSGSLAGISRAVEYKLQGNSSGGWLLTVEASKEWLSDPDRQWPVTIDPTITAPPTAAYFDCTIYSAPPIETWNKCAQNGVPKLAAEAYNRASTPDEYSRTLAFFRLIGGPIPTTADVTSAELHLYSGEAAQSTEGVEVSRLIVPWSSFVSWKYSGYPNCYTCAPWATPGGTEGEVPGTLTTTSRGGSGAGWWNVRLKEKTVQEWIAGGEPVNFGVSVKQLFEKLHSCTPTCLYRKLTFESSAASNPGLRPYLSVSYLPQAPSGKMTSPLDGTRSAKRFKLAASWTHSGVTGITFQSKNPLVGGWENIPEAKVTTKSGEAVKWPWPTKGAKQSEPIYWNAPDAAYPLPRMKGHVRAVFTGSTPAEGYTRQIELELNGDLGGPKDAKTSVGPGSVDLLTGNLSVGRRDASIPGFGSAAEFSRSFNSRDAKAEAKGVLGPGWVPGVAAEAEGGSSWRSIREESITEEWEGEEEGEEPFKITFDYAILTTTEGEELAIEKVGSSYVIPPELTGWSLVAQGGGLMLTDPGGGQTFFDNLGSGNEYVPVSVSRPGGPGNTTQMVYDLLGTKKRLKAVIAPAAAGVECPAGSGPFKVIAAERVGCRVLTFSYESMTAWKGEASLGERLASISYHAATSATAMGHWEVANYSYDPQGRLIAEWDPRISPVLKETYTYASGGQLATITPPGQEPWRMEYGKISGETQNGRLINVKRASLLTSPTTAQTTIAYEVPVSGASAPYEMSPASVAKWGQETAPVDATAIFPPDQVPPGSPPSSYSRAAIYYMDVEGQLVNSATPSGAGTSSPSITTGETDEFGNVVRELSPRNRLLVLAEATEEKRKQRWKELETKRVYSADGTQLEEEWGPTHLVRLESGTSTQARAYRSVDYNKGWPGTGLNPHLPTSETTGALVGSELLDQHTTNTGYDWDLRKVSETVVDPGEAKAGHLNLVQRIVYDKTSGLPIERRQPSNAAGGGAGTTKTIYYKATGSGECEGSPRYANLPCKITPAAQPGTAGQPQILVRKVLTYSALDQPTEVIESPGGGATSVRKTLVTYDSAGRSLTKKIEGGGTEFPKTETVYSSTTGAPTIQRLKCETSCTGFDDQATTTSYDALGRPGEYKDADGNVAKVTYDLVGRPVTLSDGKGTQTMTYDPTSGLQVKLEDSGAGTFTAAYDADGNLTERTLPNGLTAKTTYNEVGEPVHLTYTKASNCGASCTWYDEGIERSIFGQALSQTGTFANDVYAYDRAGRLTSAAETPAGGSCTTRSYSYDENSNRKSLTTRAPVAGACNWAGGTPQTYSYDTADRLLGAGLVYDSWGRITTLPASLAGGKTLTTSYFSTDMVASQTQNGVTNTFQLDGALRQRQRLQAGGLEGIEVFHYADGSDSPAWTQRGSAWTRSIAGIGGELVAVEDSSSGTTLKVTDLHGDVVAGASLNPAETKLLATYGFDEFGNPVSGSSGRFGWLGGKQRRTELASGVIQMGVRSYIPALGRFLTPDPILGGSANSYDYANQDPVNAFDLMGEWPSAKSVRQMTRRAARAARIKPVRVECRYKTCALVGGQPSDLTGTLKRVASETLRVLTSNPTEPGQKISWSRLENSIGSIITAAGSDQGARLTGCAKSALEAWNETAELAKISPAGRVASGGWALTNCVIDYFGA